MSYFEIIDDSGVINSPMYSFEEAFAELEELDENEDFTQDGDLKIVEVHYVRA